MKRTEDSLRDLWDNIKYTNIELQGFQKKKRKRKGMKKIQHNDTKDEKKP